MDLTELSVRLRALALFRRLLSEPVIEAVCTFCDCLENGWPAQIISAYGELISRLYATDTADLGRHIQSVVEGSETVYIRMIGRGETPPESMERCLAEELKTLQAVADLTPEILCDSLSGVDYLPTFENTPVDLAESYCRRVENIGKYGYSIYARYHMFYLDHDGHVVPVRHPDGTRLSDLVDYEREQRLIMDNTLALLAGRPAANVLLTGDAGTGKSSTIKAVANELYQEGLRVIEVRKDQLRLLPAILDELAANPLKFILFVDDLSFQKGDDNYSALKAILEGSVSRKSDNVAIYATSNRRHLVKESFADREGDDVHRNDTLQELLSLSERFGLQITFQKPDKATYLHIVRHLAEELGVCREDLDELAERFALGRGGRSARAARQFVDSLLASKE